MSRPTVFEPGFIRVKITARQAEALKRMTAETGMGVSELTRRALDQFILNPVGTMTAVPSLTPEVTPQNLRPLSEATAAEYDAVMNEAMAEEDHDDPPDRNPSAQDDEGEDEDGKWRADGRPHNPPTADPEALGDLLDGLGAKN